MSQIPNHVTAPVINNLPYFRGHPVYMPTFNGFGFYGAYLIKVLPDDWPNDLPLFTRVFHFIEIGPIIE